MTAPALVRYSKPTGKVEVFRTWTGSLRGCYVRQQPAANAFEEPDDDNNDDDIPTRGCITSFTRGSRQRLRLWLLHRVTAFDEAAFRFVTLTHGRDGGIDVDDSYQTLRNCLARIRRWYRARPDLFGGEIGVLDFHIKEWQNRGAVHWHLLLGLYRTDGQPVGDHVAAEGARLLRRYWLEATGTEGSARWARKRYGVDSRALSSVEGLVAYLDKELGKAIQKTPPEDIAPGRFWGHEGDWDRYYLAPHTLDIDRARLKWRHLHADRLVRPDLRLPPKQRRPHIDGIPQFRLAGGIFYGDLAHGIVTGNFTDAEARVLARSRPPPG